MILPSIPVCYHPTTVLFIDDDRAYLEALSLYLQKEHVISKIYNDPVEAIEFFNKQYSIQPFNQRCLQWTEEDIRNHRQIDINFVKIPEEVFNPERFNEISVIVIDYAMPQLNGIDFCKTIKNPMIGKILLTGEADESIASEAFNDGLINKFIRKDHQNFRKELNKAINDLQLSYFKRNSLVIVSSVIGNPEHPPSCLIDK